MINVDSLHAIIDTKIPKLVDTYLGKVSGILKVSSGCLLILLN